MVAGADSGQCRFHERFRVTLPCGAAGVMREGQGVGDGLRPRLLGSISPQNQAASPGPAEQPSSCVGRCLR